MQCQSIAEGWDLLDGVSLREEFLVNFQIWTCSAGEEYDKPFSAVNCVILNTDWCGSQGHKGIS